jgi:hypothetical protein
MERYGDAQVLLAPAERAWIARFSGAAILTIVRPPQLARTLRIARRRLDRDGSPLDQLGYLVIKDMLDEARSLVRAGAK